MPLNNSVYSHTLPKTRTFQLDGSTWATDESTFKVVERQSSAAEDERIAGWYFAFCVGAGTIVRVSVPEAEN